MDKNTIIGKLKEIHGNDKEQLEFILSYEKRIIVTAPAGCGKTKTMISKIAYELVTINNLNYKKILALTFSVNTATKIKDDIVEILPKIFQKNETEIDLTKKLETSNYHSFSTRIIQSHGYIIHKNLKDIGNFLIVTEDIEILSRYITTSEFNIMKEFVEKLKEVNITRVEELQPLYLKILIDSLIPNSIITYNGLLILAIEILKRSSINGFYKKYFPVIIVDEFQDTNYLSYKLIKSLIGEENKVFLMGDDLQKIYGFLGAIPNLFKYMVDEYEMKQLEFKTNYRFKDNEKMKRLDKYLREIFKNYDDISKFTSSAEINFKFYKKSSEEANSIVDNIVEKVDQKNKVALLVRAKWMANNIIKVLEKRKIKYFNGLFSDTDASYIKFNKLALNSFIKQSGQEQSISKKVFDRVKLEVKHNKTKFMKEEMVFNSLFRLLEVLFESTQYWNLTREKKYEKIIFILKNHSLKRLMNEIDEDIVLTTIHGSKGLEWDYVYIPEICNSVFPTYKSMCKHCKDGGARVEYEKNCEFTFPKCLRSKFEEELSLFYVAITRAKKDAYLYANTDKNCTGYHKKRSCLTSLPNLILNNK